MWGGVVPGRGIIGTAQGQGGYIRGRLPTGAFASLIYRRPKQTHKRLSRRTIPARRRLTFVGWSYTWAPPPSNTERARRQSRGLRVEEDVERGDLVVTDDDHIHPGVVGRCAAGIGPPRQATGVVQGLRSAMALLSRE